MIDVVVIVVVTLVFGFSGARITNFNIRERIIARIAKIIKATKAILIQRWRRH